MLTIYFSRFQANYANTNNDFDLYLKNRDNNESLNYIYSSQGDIFCEYDTLKLYILGGNLLIKNNNEQSYFSRDNNVISNSLKLKYSPKDESFFEQLGKPLYCKINSAETNNFYKESFNILVRLN